MTIRSGAGPAGSANKPELLQLPIDRKSIGVGKTKSASKSTPGTKSARARPIHPTGTVAKSKAAKTSTPTNLTQMGAGASTLLLTSPEPSSSKPSQAKSSSKRPTLDRLLGFIRKRQTALFAALLRACSDGAAEAVHDVRVASRRLSEPLALLGPDLPAGLADQMRRGLRRVRRAFQTVRDLDVMMEKLALTAKGLFGEPAAALALLLERMSTDRESAFATAVSAAHDRRTFRLKNRLDRLTASSSPDGNPAASRSASAVDARATARLAISRSADKALAERADQLITQRAAELAEQVARLDTDVGDPHSVRIAAKRLRYALELAEALDRPLPPDGLRQLREVQEVLGAWHDDVVLAEELTRRCFRQPRLVRDPGLSSALLGLATERLKSASGWMDRFGRLWPALERTLVANPTC